MERIQLSRQPGWRKPLGAIVVARRTRWGNPFSVEEYGRAEAVQKFRQSLDDMPPAAREAYLSPLRGAAGLCCWCRPGESCHADVLIEALGR